MSGWPTKALGDIFEIARGGSPRPIDDFITDDPAGIQWITIGDATEGSKYITSTKRRIRPEGALRSRQVKPGDFLLTNSMSFGRPYIMRTDGCIHDGWLVLSPRGGGVDADFFYYLLGSKAIYAEFERRASGATVKNLNIDLVRGVTVPFPHLPEQRRIADIMDKSDALRAKRHAALAQLRTLTQSIFLDMFGDPATNPRSWPLVAIGEHAWKIGSGSTPRGGEEAYKATGITLIRSMNVRDGVFLRDGLAFIDEEQAALLDGVVVEVDDVLLNITGASVARVCRAPADVLPARVNQHVMIIRPTATFATTFLEQCLLSSSMKDRLLRIARAGATREAITKPAIEQFRVIRPPRELQDRFAARVTASEAIQRQMRSSISQTESLFASLQHRAFRGAL